MKKLYIACISTLMLASCTKDLTSLNVDTKKPAAVPAETLFSNAQKALVDVMTSSSVNRNIFRLVTQQWTECTYFDEAQYDLTTRNIPQTFWNILYRDVLRDLEESKKIVTADNNAFTDQEARKKKLAEIDLMEVYTYSVLVNTFGNVPYTDALNVDNVHPKYDDAKAISVDLIKRIDADLSALSVNSASFGSADLLFGGNVSSWSKFGNSLKLRLGMTLADVDAAAAKSAVESAAPGAFASNADNAAFKYLDSPPSTNPIWVDLVQSGRKDFVGCNTFVNQLNNTKDPRLSVYFTKDAAGSYSGGQSGVGNNYATFSKPGSKIVAANFEALLMDYSEVEFLKAEAIARGMVVTGTATGHYNAAITASLAYWGVDGGPDAATFLASVPYNAANWKQSIGTQKWVALYNRGYDAWTEWRRLDYPVLTPATGARSGMPVRYTYPVSEQNVNVEKYNAASTAIGGDKVETKLFWDKF